MELSGPRGLTVTSGAAAELRVHFRPSDVRELRDTLLIRVSMGRNFIVPIACYMQPPILDSEFTLWVLIRKLSYSVDRPSSRPVTTKNLPRIPLSVHYLYLLVSILQSPVDRIV